jgi:RND family efflux transporter MFP subunit
MIRPLFKFAISRNVPLILLATCFLSACTTEEQPRQEVPRPVRVETMTAGPKPGLWLTGTVKTQGHADLSFEVGGVVDKVLVRPGQEVKRGALLAELDRQPSRLKLAQAQAKRWAQLALIEQAKKRLDRSRRLAEDGSLSRKELEQAEADTQAAAAAYAVEAASVSLAEREYASSQLIAPFDGRVLSYAVEPHAQISAGQRFIQLVPVGHQEVITQVPIEEARGLSLGSEATASTESTKTPLKLKLLSLAPETRDGVMQDAKFEITSPDIRLIDGATLSLQLSGGEFSQITLPQQAVRGVPKAGGAEVFVYDPKTRRVTVRSINLAGLEGDRLVVRDGLVQGNQVVTAGTAFLHDQQVVSLFRPTAGSDSE